MPAPATRAETSVGLRRLILDHARHLLVTDGYDALSMRRIAGSVGCSATSIYLYFDSKDALTHALISEGMDRLHDALAEAEEGVTAPADRLSALAHAYVAFGLANPEYYEIMFQLHPERMARYPADEYRRARRNVERFEAALTAGAADGTLAVPAPESAYAALWTALHGLVSLTLARRIDVKMEGAAFRDAAVAQALAPFQAQSLGPPR